MSRKLLAIARTIRLSALRGEPTRDSPVDRYCRVACVHRHPGISLGRGDWTFSGGAGRKESGASARIMATYFLMYPAPVGNVSAVITLLIAAVLVSAQQGVVHEKDIVKAIVDQFNKSDLVGLGELHGSQADQDLRFQVIQSRAFARKVRFIAVEGLNAFYQEDLDRYMRGEDVPLEQV